MFSVLHRLENAHEMGVWSCAWGRRGDASAEHGSEFFVTGGIDDTIKVWEVVDDKSLRESLHLQGHSLGVLSVAVSPDGQKIASSSLDSTLCIWDANAGEKLQSLALGPNGLWTIAFSPCNKFIISGSGAGKITMYSAETANVEQTLDAQNGKFILSIAYSPDGKYIASGAIDGMITIFDVATGKVAQTLEGHALSVRSLCFSPNSQMLLTGSDDGHMKIYDIANSDVACTMSGPGHSSWVLSVDYAKDGRHFASASSDGTVKVWDIAERACLHTFEEHSDQACCVRYNLQGNYLASVSKDKSVNLYNCPRDYL